MDAFHPREEAVNYDNGWTSASECNPTVNFIISITTENSSILMTYANLKSLKRILMILWIFHMWRYNSNQTSTMKKRNPNHKDKRKQDHKTKLRTGLNNSDSHMHIQVYWGLSSSVLAQILTSDKRVVQNSRETYLIHMRGNKNWNTYIHIPQTEVWRGWDYINESQWADSKHW